METIYEKMNARWQDPTKWKYEEDLIKRKCLAIFSLGNWKLEPRAWSRLMAWTKPLEDYGMIYKVRPDKNEGQLHFTLHQLTGFYENPEFSTDISGDLCEFLQPLEGLHISFRGLLLTPTGIALRGYCNNYEKLMKVRKNLPELYPDFDPPYQNDLCHATLFRWTKPVFGNETLAATKQSSPEIIQYVLDGISGFNELLAEIMPSTWNLGICSLQMISGSYKSLEEAYIPLKIAHRGLLEGANKELENDPVKILSLLESGKHVEFDVWLINNTFFIGHDEPQKEINILPFLHPGSWIHCKNYAAFQELCNIRWKDGKDIRFFWHTDENWTFTSMGDVISYPGCELYESGCHMMPENSGLSGKTLSVCSDYLNKD